jgi:hypothetical protein
MFSGMAVLPVQKYLLNFTSESKHSQLSGWVVAQPTWLREPNHRLGSGPKGLKRR